MSAQFTVRFNGQPMWFEHTTFAARQSHAQQTCAVATEDLPASTFGSEVEAWRTAQAHGLNLQLVTVQPGELP